MRKWASWLLTIGVLLAPGPLAIAQTLGNDLYQPSVSKMDRDAAIRAIPYRDLGAMERRMVDSVVDGLTTYRRLPTRVTACDPRLYRFLTENPDVVVNIWNVLNVTDMQLRRLQGGVFEIKESDGSVGYAKIIHSTPGAILVYAEGTYAGPLMLQPVKGRFLLLMRSQFVREADGRIYVTARMDTFARADSTGGDLLIRAVHPFVGNVIDTNFVQTIAFLGSLSRTAEVNGPGVQKLAMRLNETSPANRQRLAELAAAISTQAINSPPMISPERPEPVEHSQQSSPPASASMGFSQPMDQRPAPSSDAAGNAPVSYASSAAGQFMPTTAMQPAVEEPTAIGLPSTAARIDESGLITSTVADLSWAIDTEPQIAKVRENGTDPGDSTGWFATPALASRRFADDSGHLAPAESSDDLPTSFAERGHPPSSAKESGTLHPPLVGPVQDQPPSLIVRPVSSEMAGWRAIPAKPVETAGRPGSTPR